MYNVELVTGKNSRLTLTTDGKSTAVPLYSQEGLEFVSALWLKLSCEFRLMYEPRWMDIPIIQLPTDIVLMQELLWNVKPDLVIECGLAHGGSAIFYASILELLQNGRVIGVDCEVRSHNRKAIESHPLAHRIEIIEGSSIDPKVVSQIKEKTAKVKKVLVILDSNHTYPHVKEELNAYHSLVTPGSYLVAMDGAQAHAWDIPCGKIEWKEDHPLKAIREFVKEHPEFHVDPHYTRLHVTSSPEGFLKKNL